MFVLIRPGQTFYERIKALSPLWIRLLRNGINIEICLKKNEFRLNPFLIRKLRRSLLT